MTPPSTVRSEIAPARQVAYRILLRVADSDAHSDDLLRSSEVDALKLPDRHLVTTLVLGTLRWQLALDTLIRGLLTRPGMRLQPEVAIALRMGAFQLRHLERVPAHAVIHDSVELVKRGPERGAAGMVNAVLRRIPALGRWTAPRLMDSAAEIAAALAHPEWMVERWATRYGLPAAEAICRWDQEPAGVTLRIGGPEADLEEFETEPAAFLTGARRLTGGDLSRNLALREGRIRIQDEASQLVAEIAAAAAPRAVCVLDTCAAPGGKTAVLAERLPAAEITAVDASRRRLEAMRRTAQGWGSTIHFRAADVALLPLRPEFDLVLCDVPCSGTGTIGRNPEIRLRLERTEPGRQRQRQLAILRSAVAGLAPGGRLVYSTCSLEPEENEQVVEDLLNSVEGLRVLPAADLLDRLRDAGIVTAEGRERLRSATEGPFLRTIPGLHPCDGFFAAVLEHA